MAKKKPAKETGEKSKDQHKSGFMIRFPEAYRTLFKKIKKDTGMPHTTAAVRAMNDFLVKLGMTPPSDSST